MTWKELSARVESLDKGDFYEILRCFTFVLLWRFKDDLVELDSLLDKVAYEFSKGSGKKMQNEVFCSCCNDLTHNEVEKIDG